MGKERRERGLRDGIRWPALVEIWKPVEINAVSYPYEVSNLGRVRNSSGRILKTWMRGQRKGTYPAVQLSGHSWRKIIDVHRLVALHFCINPERKPEVNHINEDPMDSSAWNLEWVTRSENEKYKHYPSIDLSRRMPLSAGAREREYADAIPF